MLIKFIYTIFLGLMLATFVGMGIATFYEAPKAPEYPVALEKPLPISIDAPGETEAEKAARLQYDQDQKAYRAALSRYNRNASLIALGAVIILLVISLTSFQKLKEISDGILIGGVLTLLYSIILGFMSENNQYQFILVTIGLIIGFVLGYVKFVAHNLPTTKQE
jgi:hypothetical protein